MLLPLAGLPPCQLPRSLRLALPCPFSTAFSPLPSLPAVISRWPSSPCVVITTSSAAHYHLSGPCQVVRPNLKLSGKRKATLLHMKPKFSLSLPLTEHETNIWVWIRNPTLNCKWYCLIYYGIEFGMLIIWVCSLRIITLANGIAIFSNKKTLYSQINIFCYRIF